ncbi:MAG: 3-hydroxyacyl-CoA dehydrogenase/enoyl-CoA hydratase family protein [Burkholderiales bacterium]|nr:3-hydroxyacyl-CoA dehydrogenase/enoyl-CoA hydratase family protein [Burkholderiales bacterium]
MSNYHVRKVAVLGAGVMGAQIAAHLTNARVPAVLFDLPAKEGPKNGIVLKAIEALKKQNPAPLGVPALGDLIEAANYDDDLAKLAECDLIIEAIAERIEWKHDLYRKIAPHVAAGATLASNTSGIPIGKLAEALPAELKTRFCGVHFFNPPRYMHLVELIAIPQTAPSIMDNLEGFLTSTLGKGVLRANDTPNFIANRVGTAGMAMTLYNAERLGLTFDVVDDLTGAKIGRAKSATFGTADVVGLDTMANVINTLKNTLQADPWHKYFDHPAWLKTLLEKGALGRKTKGGVFKKVGKDILMFDPKTGEYVPGKAKAAVEVDKILKKKDLSERLKLLRESAHPQAQFLWGMYRDSFHYIAVHLAEIADTARDVDFAMRWGFANKMGPFELWQSAGWAEVAGWIRDDIAAGKTLTNVPLPGWVFDLKSGVHTSEGSWSAKENRFKPPSSHPVYARQAFRASVLGSNAASAATGGTTVFEDEGVRLWHLSDGVLIVSFKSKLNVLGPLQIGGLHRALDIAASDFQAVVIYQSGATEGGAFSAGADLQSMQPMIQEHGLAIVEPEIRKLQSAFMRMKYSPVPVVAAVAGLALGGGNELQMHAAKRVAALESYIGLVEVGVGLIPAGGGLKEAALQGALAAQAAGSTNYLDFIKGRFQTIATAGVARSAIEARAMGYLQPNDTIVFNLYELLHVARKEALALAEAGYRAPLAAKFPVAGRAGIATIKASLVGMRDGGFISEYDMLLGERVATAVCGGDIEAGSLVDEEWILRIERQGFMASLEDERTQERIYAMLTTGKPLRN